MVTPLIIDSCHVGRIFVEQFMFDDERPDIELFRAQARSHDSDEAAYEELVLKEMHHDRAATMEPVHEDDRSDIERSPNGRSSRSFQLERHRVAREDVPTAQFLYIVPAVIAGNIVGHKLGNRIEVSDHHLVAIGHE